MTEQQIEAEIHKTSNELRDKIAKLEAAKARIKSAEAEATAEAERLTGIALRRAKRQAAVDHFDTNMRPQHEQAMQEISHQLTDWRERFSQALNHFLATAQEYTQIERDYDQAMRALYADVALCAEKDKDLIGAGWNMSDLHEVIGAVSNMAGFTKPLEGLPKKAVEFAGLKPGLDAYRQQMWASAWSDSANSQRLQAIFDNLTIE
jgi:hypothetical protein